ncbi:MAG: DUF484 family protein [Albidovulum sp.]|nr:DUF484 family protein [Albidovulum sp.]
MTEGSHRKPTEFYTADIRSRIISDPGIVLDAPEVLAAVAAAADVDFGEKVVDMREIALGVLKARLDGQSEIHRKVIAATYENHVGTQNLHRAVLTLLEQENLDSLLKALRDEIPECLRVDVVRLAVEVAGEASPGGQDSVGKNIGDAVVFCPVGSVRDYINRKPDGLNPVAELRQIERGADEIYGEVGTLIRSEALLRLSPSAVGIPDYAWQKRIGGAPTARESNAAGDAWLLALGSRDPEKFKSGMGTDLITFFGEVLMRVLGRWLRS